MDVDTAGWRCGLSDALAAHQDGFLARAGAHGTAIDGADQPWRTWHLATSLLEHQMRYAGEAFRDEVDYARHFD